MTVYNFIWDMTEEQWKSYMEVCKKTKLNDHDDDMYGQLWCGDVCFEFMLYDTETYCCMSYVYGEDGGYSNTIEDNTPYNEVYNDIYLTLNWDSYDEWKTNIEKQIIDMAEKNDNWKAWLTAKTHRWH